jgi:cold shock CspA family protein
MEAARHFSQAIQREPRKFYHYWDFALALIALGAKDQAIEALEKANQLFQEEHGKDYLKAAEKLEEVKSTLPPGKRVSFDEPSKNTGVMRFGIVTKYVEDRGFGFIKDDTDGNKVFFHISRVKGKVIPQVGTRIRYVCEVGEKGLQAAKVWLLGEE